MHDESPTSPDGPGFAPSASDALRLAASLAPRLASALATAAPRERVATALERAGAPATPELRAQLGTDLRRDEGELAARFARATLRAVAAITVDVPTAVDRVLDTLDELLAAGDVAGAGRAIAAAQAEARESGSAAATEAGAIITAGLAERRRLDRLFAVASPGGAAAPEDASRWLQALDPRAIPVLLDVLETLATAEQRAVLLECLVLLGHDDPSPIVGRLPRAAPGAIPDLLRLIDRLEPPNRIELLAGSLRHPSPEVRLEILAALARLRTEAARAPVAAALDDAAPEVRAEAARLLVRFGPERALQDLLHAVRSPGFEDRRAAERAAFFQALGETGLPGALAFFREVLGQRGLLGRGKAREAKLLAIAGLSAAPSIGSFRSLQSARADADPDVAAAASAACTQVRAALVGAREVH